MYAFGLLLGSCQGFPGVILRFYFKTRPAPKVYKRNLYVYPISHYEQVMRWMVSVSIFFDAACITSSNHAPLDNPQHQSGYRNSRHFSHPTRPEEPHPPSTKHRLGRLRRGCTIQARPSNRHTPRGCGLQRRLRRHDFPTRIRRSGKGCLGRETPLHSRHGLA